MTVPCKQLQTLQYLSSFRVGGSFGYEKEYIGLSRNVMYRLVAAELGAVPAIFDIGSGRSPGDPCFNPIFDLSNRTLFEGLFSKMVSKRFQDILDETAYEIVEEDEKYNLDVYRDLVRTRFPIFLRNLFNWDLYLSTVRNFTTVKNFLSMEFFENHILNIVKRYEDLFQFGESEKAKAGEGLLVISMPSKYVEIFTVALLPYRVSVCDKINIYDRGLQNLIVNPYADFLYQGDLSLEHAPCVSNTEYHDNVYRWRSDLGYCCLWAYEILKHLLSKVDWCDTEEILCPKDVLKPITRGSGTLRGEWSW